MKFKELASYFEELEKTSSRLSIIDILSQLFKKVGGEEARKISYLIQGRVAPFYEPTELGMAENMVAVSIARAFNTSKDEVIYSYRQLGNMGLAAKDLSKRKDSTLTVSEVFDSLFSIAHTGGEGSVEKKVLILSDLLSKLDSISVKHIVNIPVGTLRLGIGDPTVMDALSVAKLGDKSARTAIEEAYNKTSDLGLIAETFFNKGLAGLKSVKLIVGKPVRPSLAERLPNAEEAVKRLGEEFAAEPKFDGFRVAIHKKGKEVSLFSRNLENTTNAFPDIVMAAQNEIKADSVILEGEAIAYNPTTQEFLPFQETTKRRRKHGIEEAMKRLPLIVFAFDLLYLNGRDVTEKSYSERRKLLESVLSKDNLIIKISEERVLKTAKQILTFFDEVISEGLEGLMLKKLDSPYKAGGRGYHWIKFKRSQSGKLLDSVDCVLLGIYTGRGKRTEFGVGGLLVGVYNKEKDMFESVSRIGTGLTDEEFRKLNEIGQSLKVAHVPSRVSSKIEPSYWVTPKVVLEIYADEITRSPIHTAAQDKEGVGLALRFPRVMSFRDDKKPEDATTTKELMEMFKMQGKQK